MDRTTIDWSGPMVAVTTPFRADLSIDEEAFSANVQRLYAAGATGIVAAGCTGEFWALDLAERERLARLTVAASAGRGPAIIGTGSIREEEIITQIHAAKEAGADGVLVMPPYFVRSSEAEIIAHFEAIDARSVLPILLYNIPGNAGNELTPEITGRPCRSRQRRRHQGKQRQLEHVSGNTEPCRWPDPCLLRPVLGPRCAGGARRGGRYHRLLSQRLGTRMPRPVAHGQGRPPARSLGASAHGHRNDRTVHDRAGARCTRPPRLPWITWACPAAAPCVRRCARLPVRRWTMSGRAWTGCCPESPRRHEGPVPRRS